MDVVVVVVVDVVVDEDVLEGARLAARWCATKGKKKQTKAMGEPKAKGNKEWS